MHLFANDIRSGHHYQIVNTVQHMCLQDDWQTSTAYLYKKIEKPSGTWHAFPASRAFGAQSLLVAACARAQSRSEPARGRLCALRACSRPPVCALRACSRPPVRAQSRSEPARGRLCALRACSRPPVLAQSRSEPARGCLCALRARSRPPVRSSCSACLLGFASAFKFALRRNCSIKRSLVAQRHRSLTLCIP